MKKKIALSTFYNLCIFGCLILAWKGITDKHYDYILAAVFGGVIFVVLKIKLLKEVRNTLKP
ncbi:DUF6358 family protein [Mucilaginibacter sp. UR6-11]|uniref:DUF6358 family protein n=1 Tax=Mucilaginibacter sp. UR6-11 TaxID=1435644 RepID=UPI001E528267|nr:DUF6358 family protein [Mucilaginibacter sp. UR6-11]MCC8424601.1 DUF6358 family protein [Mucilaginibacter sp. UR6-11]